MADIRDNPPTIIRNELAELREQLDIHLPDKVLDHNLLIATWNIRMFGRITKKWQAALGDSPKRDLHALRCIAEIVSRFDVIALQEVRENLQGLRYMLKWLGPNWSFVLTDVTKGAAGNGERMAYVFDTRKVQMSGLACELVLSADQLDNAAISANALDKQFARTPYAVSFKSGKKTFILVTLHVLFGSSSAQRVPELEAVAGWMADWAQDLNAYHQNFIVLGDFNIDRKGDALYEAFTSTGLKVPDDLNQVPRTIFADPDNPSLEKFYDQIAWFTGSTGQPALSLKYNRGGYFDFVRTAMRSRDFTKQQLSFRISDHFPLWGEFLIRE
jgi:endonuclease/exonuclease/phosphatase family metal-dependent hydrolase